MQDRTKWYEQTETERSVPFSDQPVLVQLLTVVAWVVWFAFIAGVLALFSYGLQ